VVHTKFENISILNFQWGSFVQGLYNSSFQNCFIQNCWNGIFFQNQSVTNSLINNVVQLVSAGTLITGPGFSTGISAQGAPEVEDLKISHGSVFGFNYDFALGLVFELQIEHVDVSFATICPIYFTSVIGPFVIRDCWIELSGSGVWNGGSANQIPGNLTGIFITAITPNVVSKVVIEGNELVCDVPAAGSTAIYIGNSNNGIAVHNNQGRGWDVGIGGGNTLVNNGGTFSGGSIRNNTLNATSTGIMVASGCTELELGPNYILTAATPYAFTGGPPTSMLFQQPNVPMQGTVTFASSTTAVVTFANPMPFANYVVSPGGNAAGNCWPSAPTVNGFTMNCSVSNNNTMGWTISA
jgi:hypothetical protein